MFSTRVLQTVSLVSGLDSRILIRLGALRYVTATYATAQVGVAYFKWPGYIQSNTANDI